MTGLRIAVIGARGVPATFGGIEHHVEELGARMVERGHHVTVFARTNYLEEPISEHRGIKVVPLPTIATKHLDAIAHSGLATARAMTTRFDIIHYHAIGPGIWAGLPRVASPAKVVLTVHGRDGERGKWGRGAASALTGAEWLSARVPDATIVVSEDLARHYREEHGRRAVHIPNGVERGRRTPPDRIARDRGLSAGSYLLFVGRLVPEKAPDQLLAAFRGLDTDRRLVIAGGTSFTDTYVERLESLASADERVVMAGYVYGEDLRELYANAAVFVLPSLLEGLPLTLLEAASYGTPVIASDIPPHLEIVGEDAPGHRLFTAGSVDRLRDALSGAMLADPHDERVGAEELRDDVLARYNWDDVTERTLGVYRSVLGGRAR